jgi:dTDP-4-amino-4,6-dideoxygalactose transaminase
MVGWNCRMDGIQAAILRIKLRFLERCNQLRRSHAVHYDEVLGGIEEVVTPARVASVLHAYHIYAIRIPDRDEVIRCLSKNGIECGIHYRIPIHLQQAYRSLGYQRGAFPIAERCASEFISLPMFPELIPEQVETVAAEVKEAIAVGVVA